MEGKRKIIVAISGASGAVYAKRLLEKIASLKEKPLEVAVIFTRNADEIWKYEIGERFGIENQKGNTLKLYDNMDFFAPFASGSARYDTMIICPASMGMLGRIANGVADDLITRAADVMLKERRKLILVPRETPYNLVHINNMKLLTEAGAIILPASPSFYSKPVSIDDLVMTIVERIMDIAGFGMDANRWGEN